MHEGERRPDGDAEVGDGGRATLPGIGESAPAPVMTDIIDGRPATVPGIGAPATRTDIIDGRPATLPGLGAAVGATIDQTVLPEASEATAKGVVAIDETMLPDPAKATAKGVVAIDEAPPAKTHGIADTLAAAVAPARPLPRSAFGIAETLPAGAVPPPAQPGFADTIGGTGTGVMNTQGASADTMAAAPGGTLPGPYTVADLPTLPRVDDATYAIGNEIARGGMGKILAARDRRLRREVVIKVMRREYGRIDPRFEREALITARLQHPSIVRVYDAGVLGDGRAFYAMERVRGRSLEVVLEEAKELRDRLALLPHAIAVCEALAYAHNEGIVHRDLKPSNILLGPFGETVVIDWGLAKDLKASEAEQAAIASRGFAAARSSAEGSAESNDSVLDDPMSVDGSGVHASDSALTQHGAVMGTPAFMAPEQARGEVADERTDVYALGALLYTMLTGGPPVSGTSSDEVIDAVASGRRKRILEAEPQLPPELASIVEHAMRHERADRYATAKALADDLRSFAAGKLVPTHTYTNAELIKRWVLRHRVSVGIGSAALLLLVIIGVVGFLKVRDERDLANEQRALADRQRAAAIVARQDADDRWDNFIIERAQALEPTDPSLAAAWLKGLSDRAMEWEPVSQLAARLPAAGLAHQLAGHEQDVELIVPSLDGIHIASASDDATVRWWDLATGGSLQLSGHVGPIDTMQLSHDGTYLATGGTDHNVILWTLATGEKRVLLDANRQGHTNTVRGLAFSPDNTKLASTSEDGTLFLWDVATGTGERLLKHAYALRPITWFNATTLVIGAFDGGLGRIDVPTRRTTWTHPHNAELRTIAVAPDRGFLVIGDEDGRVTLTTPQGKTIRELTKHEDVAREAIVTADGKYVVTAGNDNNVHVHSLPGGELRALKGNTAGIKDIDVSADGLVVGAGIDGAVRVWQLDGTLIHTWRGHTASVKGVAFAGRYVISGAEDKMIRVWRLDEPAPPPKGPALRAWLDQNTNLLVPSVSVKTPR